jgi:hypothetical protein
MTNARVQLHEQTSLGWPLMRITRARQGRLVVFFTIIWAIDAF